MPKITDPLERREAIAAAAAAAIAELGVERATLREVAARSGVSRGVVDHYFRNREDLIETALLWVNDRYLARERRRTRGLEGLAALRARIGCILPFTADARQEWRIRLCSWSVAAIDPRAGEQQRERLGLTLARYEGDLRQARSAGELAPGVDVEQGARELMALVAGLCAAAVVAPRLNSRAQAESTVEQAIARLARKETR